MPNDLSEHRDSHESIPIMGGKTIKCLAKYQRHGNSNKTAVTKYGPTTNRTEELNSLNNNVDEIQAIPPVYNGTSNISMFSFKLPRLSLFKNRKYLEMTASQENQYPHYPSDKTTHRRSVSPGDSSQDKYYADLDVSVGLVGLKNSVVAVMVHKADDTAVSESRGAQHDPLKDL